MLRRYIIPSALWLIATVFIVIAACGGDDDADGTDGTPTDGDGTGTPAQTGEGLLATVLDRGELICGVNDSVPGFGFVESDGSNTGFDVDYCKAVALAVLGDAEAVQYVPLTADARLPAVQTGQVDVLIRNTTMTVSRDAGSGLSFATTTYYDGQGLMVRDGEGFTTVDDLATSTICTLQGTTTELNLTDRLPNSDPLPFVDNDTLQAAFIEVRCDGWTSDRSQLAARQSAYPDSVYDPTPRPRHFRPLTNATATPSRRLRFRPVSRGRAWSELLTEVDAGLVLRERDGSDELKDLQRVHGIRISIAVHVSEHVGRLPSGCCGG